MKLTSSGGQDNWREEGEARMVAGDPYRGLIGIGEPRVALRRVGGRGEGGAEHRSERTPRCVSEERSANARIGRPRAAVVPCHSTPCGREAR